MFKQISIGLAIAITLAACSDTHQPVSQHPQQASTQPVSQHPQQASTQPVIVNQTPAQSSTATDMIVGGMAGYLVGQALSTRNAQPTQPQVVEKRTYIVRDQPTVARAQTQPMPTAQPAALAAPVKQFAVPQTQVAPKNAITSVPNATKPAYTWTTPSTSRYSSPSSYSTSRTTTSKR